MHGHDFCENTIAFTCLLLVLAAPSSNPQPPVISDGGVEPALDEASLPKKKTVRKVVKAAHVAQKPPDSQPPTSAEGDAQAITPKKKRIVRVAKPKSSASASDNATAPEAASMQSADESSRLAEVPADPSLYQNPLNASLHESFSAEGRPFVASAPAPEPAPSGIEEGSEDAADDMTTGAGPMNLAQPKHPPKSNGPAFSDGSETHPRIMAAEGGAEGSEIANASTSSPGSQQPSSKNSVNTVQDDSYVNGTDITTPSSTSDASCGSTSRPRPLKASHPSSALSEHISPELIASDPQHGSRVGLGHGSQDQSSVSPSMDPIPALKGPDLPEAPTSRAEALEELRGVGDLSRATLEALAVQLHETAAAGRGQLVKDAEQISHLQQVSGQLEEL